MILTVGSANNYPAIIYLFSFDFLLLKGLKELSFGHF